MNESGKNLKKDNDLNLILRCQNPSGRCKKILGIVDKDGLLHTQSSRSWIKTKMSRGFVECQKCGNEIEWDAETVKRR